MILLEGKEKDFKSDEDGLKKQIKNVQGEIQKQTKRLKPVDNSLKSIEDLQEQHSKLTQLSTMSSFQRRYRTI